MVKIYACFLIFFCCNLFFAQDTIHFFDNKNLKPIYFVQIFNSQRELLTVSDINGMAILEAKDSLFIAKHLDFKTYKFDLKEQNLFYLQSNIIDLNEVTIKPGKIKNLYFTLLKNSKTQIPKQNFHGLVKFEAKMYELAFDSISKKLDDSILIIVQATFQFQFIYKSKKDTREVLIFPIETEISYASFKNRASFNNNFHNLFSYFLDFESFFESDFYGDKFEKFKARRKFTISKSDPRTASVKISNVKKEGEFNFNALLDYNETDTTLISFESLLNKTTRNNIGVEALEKTTYDTLNGVYFIKNRMANFYGKTGEELSYSIVNINLGDAPNLDEFYKFNLKDYIQNLKPTFPPFKTGMFPKRFYELFKYQ